MELIICDSDRGVQRGILWEKYGEAAPIIEATIAALVQLGYLTPEEYFDIIANKI